ncbi:MAG: biotin transporter BioY [Dehalococcoidia bacterium]|nr:biotin transporter BioY [Dehalococcoidia bacterium]
MQNQLRPATLVEALVPGRNLTISRALLRDVLLVVGFSALIALSARIAVFLPFTPVPITAQTLAVLLTGAVLGSKRGALALLAYIAEGAAGLPVFSAGRAGLPILLGPSGGYIWGFLAAAFLVGFLTERGWDRTVWTAALAMLIGTAIIYLFGVPQLAFVLSPTSGAALGLDKALALGVLPFLPGDAIKLLIAAGVLPSAWALLGHK